MLDCKRSLGLAEVCSKITDVRFRSGWYKLPRTVETLCLMIKWNVPIITHDSCNIMWIFILCELEYRVERAGPHTYSHVHHRCIHHWNSFCHIIHMTIHIIALWPIEETHTHNRSYILYLLSDEAHPHTHNHSHFIPLTYGRDTNTQPWTQPYTLNLTKHTEHFRHRSFWHYTTFDTTLLSTLLDRRYYTQLDFPQHSATHSWPRTFYSLGTSTRASQHAPSKNATSLLSFTASWMMSVICHLRKRTEMQISCGYADIRDCQTVPFPWPEKNPGSSPVTYISFHIGHLVEPPVAVDGLL